MTNPDPDLRTALDRWLALCRISHRCHQLWRYSYRLLAICGLACLFIGRPVPLDLLLTSLGVFAFGCLSLIGWMVAKHAKETAYKALPLKPTENPQGTMATNDWLALRDAHLENDP